MKRLAKIAGWWGIASLGWLVGLMQFVARAEEAPVREAPAPPVVDKHIVAHVNGVPITRQELAEHLLIRKGKEHIKFLINRKIIEQACQKAGIIVTDAEVDADVKEIMKAVQAMTPSQFEESMLKPRGLTMYEYREDVVRPRLAVQKLAGTRVQVTEEDLRRAFEARYGERVKCRVIFYPDERSAILAYPQIKNDRDAFLRAAQQQADPYLQAKAGEVQISRFSTLDNLEEAAFRLKDGEVSPVLQVKSGGWAVLLREGLVAADPSKKLEEVQDQLRAEVFEQKLQQVAPQLMKELREQAVVRDYLNNKFDIKEVMKELDRKTPPGSAAASAPKGK